MQRYIIERKEIEREERGGNSVMSVRYVTLYNREERDRERGER